jgi:hypothetical protein
MKIFEIFGLSRSGHHAMTNWLIKNISGQECGMNWKLNIMSNNVYYINEGNLDKHLTKQYLEDHKNSIRSLFVSYENCFTNFTIFNDKEKYEGPMSINNTNITGFTENYRIVFIRDFYDNLASRIKSNEEKLSKTRDGIFQPWNIEEGFIEKWKENAKTILNNKCIHLKFEDWLISSDYRNRFVSQILTHGELFDNRVSGTHSSFGDKNVLDRISQVTVPEKVKKLIYSDNELHYLIGALGYQYKKI